MKTQLLLIIITLLVISAHSQTNWVFNPGATWHYNVSYGSYGGYEKLTYYKDTIIDNKRVAVVSVDAHEVGLIDPDTYYHKDTSYPNRYFYRDSTWMYEVTDGRFGFLYKLDPEIGESWEITNTDTCCECSNTRVTVTDKGTTSLDDATYSWYDIKSDSTSMIDVNSKIFVGVGPKRFPLQYQVKNCNGSITDNAVYDIMCFQDGVISVKFIPEDCDHIRFLSVNDLLYYNTKIYPNPANEVINISSDAALKRVAVYDYMGRMLFEEYANRRRNLELPISNIDPGLYLVRVETSRGMISKQVVIE